MIVKLTGIEKIHKVVRSLNSKQITASSKSALNSVGYFLIGELKKQIKSKGSHAGGKWERQHPLTRLPKARTGKRQKLRLKKSSPLKGLSKFTRYRVSKNAVQVLFARSKKGQVGQIDRLINSFVARSEFGETQALSSKAKRFRAARGFPVRKDKSTIRIPARPLVSPVYRKNKRELISLYTEKFNRSVQRKILKAGK